MKDGRLGRLAILFQEKPDCAIDFIAGSDLIKFLFRHRNSFENKESIWLEDKYMRKSTKLLATAFALATVGLGGVASAGERSPSICDMEPTSFEVWFLQKFYC
ncbi:hypothetical protein K3172_01635 [Qipengyuania sp. 6B39]|uniref:hypothetical protein n=1 Tax=Qipengyuania proteolytica TaxID=2867239 RepID=UPI001C8A296C|nr:hypothetical protein [Qipengyuania proteolytica]MBX7494552.1 hypothetical protein [Qipengyuania proteolytica]